MWCDIWFFHAWVCTTLWGLDQIDPNTAITAMQAMNASVRNVVYAPVFFATPVVLLASALLAFSCRNRRAALYFTMAGLVYGFGGMALTMAINVPLNQALALIVTPLAPAQASAVWTAYSETW